MQAMQTFEKAPTFEFEGRTLTTIQYRGEPVWLALDLGNALGYARNGSVLTDKIRKQWPGELVEGEDYYMVRGQELRDLKKLLEPSTVSVGSRAPSVMVLNEDGLLGACLLSRKPFGRRLRKWLRSDVLPSIRATGSYEVPDVIETTEPAADYHLINAEARAMREERLKMREERLRLQLMHDSMMDVVKEAKDEGKVDGVAVLGFRMALAEQMWDVDLSALAPRLEKPMLSATEVGKLLGVTPQKVGWLAKKLELKGGPHTQPILSTFTTTSGNVKQRTGFLYAPEAVDQMRARLASEAVSA